MACGSGGAGTTAAGAATACASCRPPLALADCLVVSQCALANGAPRPLPVQHGGWQATMCGPRRGGSGGRSCTLAPPSDLRFRPFRVYHCAAAPCPTRHGGWASPPAAFRCRSLDMPALALVSSASLRSIAISRTSRRAFRAPSVATRASSQVGVAAPAPAGRRRQGAGRRLQRGGHRWTPPFAAPCLQESLVDKAKSVLHSAKETVRCGSSSAGRAAAGRCRRRQAATGCGSVRPAGRLGRAASCP